MSMYRNILAAVAALAIAAPVFADDANTNNNNTQTLAEAQTTTTTTQTTEETQVTEQGKVNLNKASSKELMKVKGLNASKARSIVAYRKKHGDFKSTDELSNVKRIQKK